MLPYSQSPQKWKLILLLNSGSVILCSRGLGQIYEHTERVGGYRGVGCPTAYGR